MAKGKRFDKKNAQHFTLVHRPQNDPLIHDENAPSMVLNPVPQKGGFSKVKHLSDLASELGSDAMSIRENEGEAAEYGVYYDDTQYDYMQHLRDLNSGGGEAVWLEAPAATTKDKGKNKEVSLEDALRQMDLEHKSEALLDASVLPNKNLQRANYQNQQDIPDAIAGFQPDMDPRLREVLEALEDDAYVDEDEDIFQELSKDAREIDQYEFEDQFDYDDEDEGWESDGTAKPSKEYKDGIVPQLIPVEGEALPEHQNEDWLEDFKQFKKDQKGGKAQEKAAPSELQSSIWTTTTMGGRKKKRKGALTNPSAYSMTSSSMVRTEQLTLLDARFDKIEEEYTSEMGGDDMASISEVSTATSVTGPTRGDFDSIMDDFLGSYTKPGKRTNKKNRPQTGLEQLDEIRKGLGPARLRPKDYRV
ncbi:low temperature viability protein [Colletotrichum caudatum]|nr:low temperature viability protein [Colletotrichum caudatum]